jgi:muconate cycloisomerase
VILEDDSGVTGCGEGAPRDYVTGETIIEGISKAEILVNKLPSLNFKSITLFLNSLNKIGQSDIAVSSPSVWCAFETACLDLYSKLKNIPLWNLFTNTIDHFTFEYSAVIPLLPIDSQKAIFDLISKNKIQQIKLKVDSVETGVEQVRYAREKLGEKVDIRVDANAAFTTSQTIDFLEKVRTYSISALEQPVGKNDLNAFKKIKSNCNEVLIFADESINTFEDAKALINADACHGFNIRLSKCGGLTNCFKLCQMAKKNNIYYQIGCHVGESNILSALGRHLALLCPNYLYLEGSFSKYILIDDITNEEISFSYRGTADQLTGPGLGVSINFDKINKWTELQHKIVL